MSINEFNILVNIEKLYLKGISRKEIAERYSLSIDKVNEYLNMASKFRVE